MMGRSRVAIGPVVLCALTVAFVLLAMPAGLVETLVASSGLSEAVPAAAPPLGMKARLLLAAFGALMGAGIAWAGWVEGRVARQEQEDGGREGAPGVKIMGFALSKLSWLARSRGPAASAGSRPASRRADAHPDAPVRAPIFASRDFGGLDIFPRISTARDEGADAVEAEPSVVLALPRMAPASPADQPVDAEYEEIVEPVEEVHVPAAAEAEYLPPLSIAELTQRLERGLARRVRSPRTGDSPVLADMPVEQAVPVRDHVDDEADRALRAALETLRAMADRTR